jgi:hypothetical protein
MKMAKFNLFHWLGIATSGVMNLLGKANDGDVTLVEALDVAESVIKQGLPDMNSSDLTRFGAITSQGELEAFDFFPGDVLVVIPVELVGKLKIEFTG